MLSEAQPYKYSDVSPSLLQLTESILSIPQTHLYIQVSNLLS